MVEFSPTFKRQAAMGTALAQADLTRAITATAKDWSPQFDEKLFADCTTQYVRKVRTLRRWAEMTLEFETSVHVLGGWMAFAVGQDSASGTNPITHQENLIKGRVLPVTTLRIGHDDGVDTGWIWKDVAVDSIAISGDDGGDSSIRVRMVLVGSGSLVAATGTTWADCDTSDPVTLFDASRSLNVNSTEYITTAHNISCVYSNNIPRRAAFTAGSLDVQRWVRGRVRTYTLQFQIEGIDAPADALSILARANSGAGTVVANTLWRFGVTNQTFAVNIPSGNLKFVGSPQGYLPEEMGETAVLNLQVIGLKDTNAVTKPVNFTAVVPSTEQATAYLLT